MKEVVTIVSRKGGTGKTTTAQCLGAALQLAGDRVLLIDLDAQANLTAAMGAEPGGFNVTDLFDGSAQPSRIVQHTTNGDIITGCAELAAGDVELKSNDQLKKAIKPLLKEYDYLIIDTPASYGRLTMNALTAATSAIITLEPATFSTQGVDELAGIVKQIRRANKRLNVRGILVTRCDGRSNEVKRTIAEIKDAAARIHTRLIEPPIRATAKVFEAQRHRQNLTDYAPRSTAARDYMEVAKALFNQ